MQLCFTPILVTSALNAAQTSVSKVLRLLLLYRPYGVKRERAQLSS